MRRTLAIILLSFAVIQLGFRGWQRIHSEVPMWDFASVYAATQTWMHHGNPYDTAMVVNTWKHDGLFADREVGYFATVYLPISLVALVPFAALPAAPAMAAWLLLTLALLAFQFIALLDMAKLKLSDPRALLLIGASLASAALQFGILSGQLSIPAISMCIIAFWMAQKDRHTLAGVLLGLACAVKPQIGGPFVLYYLALHRWNVGLVACVLGGLLLVGSVAAMKVSHIDWLPGWKASVASTEEVGHVNDYGWTNLFRDGMFDLKMILVSFIHSKQLLRVAVVGVFAAMAAWYWRVFPRTEQRRGRDELLVLAGLSALALLPIYHRVYDATLLTTALAWALAELDGNRRRYAVAMLVPLTIFLVPFDIVKTIAQHSHKLEHFFAGALWQTFFAPHYAWALLGTTLAVLWTMSKIFQEPTEPFRGVDYTESRMSRMTGEATMQQHA